MTLRNRMKCNKCAENLAPDVMKFTSEKRCHCFQPTVLLARSRMCHQAHFAALRIIA